MDTSDACLDHFDQKLPPAVVFDLENDFMYFNI